MKEFIINREVYEGLKNMLNAVLSEDVIFALSIINKITNKTNLPYLLLLYKVQKINDSKASPYYKDDERKELWEEHAPVIFTLVKEFGIDQP